MAVIRAMADHGNPNSVSDAGVGALCARLAVRGAYLNVRINTGGLDDAEHVRAVLAEGAELERRAADEEAAILKIVDAKLAQTA